MRRSILLALAVTACGGSDAFKLTAEDNNPDRIDAAFARMEGPRRGPVNATGKPVAYLVARGKQSMLVIAFDLAAKQELWRADADVASKVVVGGGFVAYLDRAGELVGRDSATGKVLWKNRIGGKFVGAAADKDRLFYTVANKSTWELVALDGSSGDELWREESTGALGAPAARGGLVFSPFLKQWLAVLDGKSGEQLTRIRGIDEAITFVRAGADHVYFGSQSGVFLLDRRAASGKRAQSTFGAAKLPKEFVRIHYDLDAFDPVQSGYSAYDRNRILWRGAPAGRELRFTSDRVVVHTYRYFFGFDAQSGKLAWAYSNPRIDVVASEHVGPVIGFVAMNGAIGALDPTTGGRLYQARVEAQVVGATFDAEGWAPREAAAGQGQQGTSDVLATIANDRDARFEDVKRFAVSALATLGGGQITGDLVTMIQSEKTPAHVYEAAIEALVAKRDPASLSVLVTALDVQYDFIAGTRPRAVGALARAIAALAPEKLEPAQRGRATDALIAHLQAPETPAADLEGVIQALGAIGAGAEIAPLRSFVLMYRADETYANQVGALGAAIDVLLARGGQGERELVTYVSEDVRSLGSVKEYASRALLQTTTQRK